MIAMNVRCGRCGEELLGAVNSCWKCGQVFDAPTSSEPPIVTGAGPAQGSDHAVETVAGHAPDRMSRSDSPHASAGGAAISWAGFALATGAFFASLASFWALVPAVLAILLCGIGLGQGRRRAVVGIALACVALIVASVKLTDEVRQLWRRNHPADERWMDESWIDESADNGQATQLRGASRA